MRSFISTLLVFLIFQSRAQAMVYSGILTQDKDFHLRLKEETTGKTYELTYADSNAANILKKLKKNDFISFTGARNSNISSIRVDSVNYVGLGDLLDIWKGDDHYCYAFTSFKEFAVYPAEKSNCVKYPTYSSKYAYTINPTEQSNWVILLSGSRSNYLADLTVKTAKSIEISLYDSNTGYILKLIKLRK